MEAKRYSEEEARNILKKAVELETQEGDFSREELLSMAEELEIPPERLVAAEKAWLGESQGQTDIQAFDKYRRQRFRNQLFAFISTTIFLAAINLLTSPSHLWFLYPFLGWGLAIAAQAWELNQHEGQAYERQLAQWEAKQLEGKPRSQLPL